MYLSSLIRGVLALPILLVLSLPSAAQVTDPRVAQLEEQVRQLNGLVEELNFQILQMQDQLRRMQEDNEIRFQEMEERKSDASGAAPRTQDNAQAPQAPQPQAGSGDDDFYAALPSVEGAPVLGTPPRTMGSVTFDEHGNPRSATIVEPPAQTDGSTVAALPPGGDNDDELYRNAYEFVLSGDYDTAEAGFRDLIARYPDSEHSADAHFWLGEALLAQERPREAAEIFLSASRSFPQARKAPDTLFKLGVSLASMKQRDVACATFSEVLQRYPQVTDALKNSIREQQSQASC
jgi:tol-pal system protein YbgF